MRGHELAGGLGKACQTSEYMGDNAIDGGLLTNWCGSL